MSKPENPSALINSYREVQFPFDTEMSEGHGKVRLLAAICNDYASHIVGYTYCGDDPLTSCSQVLEWDEFGKFGGGSYPSMDLVPPPGAVASLAAKLNEEIASIQKRLDENPDAPVAWTNLDRKTLDSLEAQLAGLEAPHIWGALSSTQSADPA